MQKLLFTFCFLSSVYTFAQYPLTTAGYLSTAPFIVDGAANKFVPAAYINAKGAITTPTAQAATGLYIDVSNTSSLADVGIGLNLRGNNQSQSKFGIFSNGEYTMPATITGINLSYANKGSGKVTGTRHIMAGQNPWCFDATSTTYTTNGASKGGDFLANTEDLAGGTGTAYGLYSVGEAGAGYGVYAEGRGTSANSGVSYGIFATAYGATNNYAGYFAGNVTVTGTFNNPSDAKLKQNIQGIGDALNKVMQLTPANYEFKTNDYQELNLSKGTHYGFVAQEVEKVFPALVSENHMVVGRTRNFRKAATNEFGQPATSKPDSEAVLTEPVKSVNYLEMIPILTKAIQEQQAMIQKQQTQIESLKAELNELKNRN